MRYIIEKKIEELIFVETGALVVGEVNTDEFFFTGLKITLRSSLQTHKELLSNKIFYIAANIRYTFQKGNIIINAAGGRHLNNQVFIQADDMNLTLDEFNEYVIEVNGLDNASIQFGSGIPTGSTETIPNLYNNTDDGTLYAWNGSSWALVGGGLIYGEYGNDAHAAANSVPLGGVYVRSIETGFHGLLSKRLI